MPHVYKVHAACICPGYPSKIILFSTYTVLAYLICVDSASEMVVSK